MSLCINVERLSKSYGRHEVIRDLSLAIEEGDVVVCQGPSGIGKSTFLRCLTHLEPFEQGSIRVGDLTLRAGMDPRREKETIKLVRERLGFVFQFFNLFPHLTVLENLAIGPLKVLGEPAEVVRERALGLLDRVGLAEKADAHPHALSGGQQQRVGIARALCMKPRAILFDEPTSSLDPEMKGEIVNVMADLAGDGLTMVVVTHEPAVLDRIAKRIVKFGPQCTILEDRRV